MNLVIKILELIIALIENKYFFRTRYDKQNLIILKIYKNLRYKEPNKWYICNLFYQLTQLNLNFDDIKLLLQNDDVSKIVYFISKYRGIYTYKNGFFIEKKSRLMNKLFNRFIKLSGLFFFCCLVAFVCLLFFFAKSAFRTDSIFYTSSDCIRILGLLFKSDR